MRRPGLLGKILGFLGDIVGRSAKYLPALAYAFDATWVLSAPTVEEGVRRTGASVGAVLGTAIGAYLGSFIPVPVLGTWLGAAIGGLVGGSAVYYAEEVFKGIDIDKLVRQYKQQRTP